jgi:UDP-N-acetylglucosamine 2-epimerase (non-hydrolysing)
VKIHLIAAARPNFMKIAPLYHELKKYDGFDVKIIHTGQHYDKNMSNEIFLDLELPEPDINLGVSGGSHAFQVGTTMIAYEIILKEESPDLVIVVGDVNASLACAITAKKLHIKVAHLEAGLRSFDMNMPEEINRVVTDSIVDYFWTPSIDANENLVRNGTKSSAISLVGNIMLDSLEMMRVKIEKENILHELNLQEKKYVVVTFHRPSNVDHKVNLKRVVENIISLSVDIKIVFPVHPRTKQKLKEYCLYDLLKTAENVIVTKPLRYKQFMKLVFSCSFIITDSGGIQEEATYLQIPCLTLRDNTERPITVTMGTNTLVNFHNLKENINCIMSGNYKNGTIPLLWDGRVAHRIVKCIDKIDV